MVEAVAEQLKISVKQFLEDAREGRLEFAAAGSAVLMVAQHHKFLDFLMGKWTEGAEARAQTRSVKEGMEQQINLMGSKAIYDRVSYRLSRLDITSDPFFNKEQLMLFKWRVEFFNKFFPIEAAIAQYHSYTRYEASPGWWDCFGAGNLPLGPPLSGLPWNDHYPQYALAGMAFDWVLHQAFHMGEDVVQFSQAFHDVPLEMRINRNPWYDLNPRSLFAIYGEDYDYKYWLFCDTPEEEEFVFKFVHSVDEETIEEGDGMPLGYLKQVVWALHSQGPPSLTELAIKKVLELELPLEDLPKDVLDMIEEGPQSRPMTKRGVHLVEVLEQKEKEAMVEHLLQEEELQEEEMASLLAKKVVAKTESDESFEVTESAGSIEETESDESIEEEGEETESDESIEEEGEGTDDSEDEGQVGANMMDVKENMKKK